MVEQRDLDIIFSNAIDWERFRDKTILITGATGRLGMYFVEALNKADLDWNMNMRIIAHARNEKKLKRVFGSTLELPNIRTVIQDITEPIRIQDKANYIIHTAGAASPVDFTNKPVDTLWGHVQGTRNVLEYAKECRSDAILYVSTVETYGDWDKEERVREEDMGVLRCDVARSCYPEAKRLCETMMAAYQEQYGLNYIGVRLCHTFGPGIPLDDGRSYAEFFSNVINGEDIILHSDGSAMRTYTYVADAIGGMLLAFTKGEYNQYYNIANSNNLFSTKELAKKMADMSASQKIAVKYMPESESGLSYLPFRLAIMNTDKIERLGWRGIVGINETLRYTLESFL